MPAYLDRLAELAKRLTPGAGHEVLTDVSPELMYAVIAENDRPEHQILHATRLWAINLFLAAAGAGNFNTFVVGQSSSEGLLSVLTHYLIPTGAQALNFQFMANAFAGFTSYGAAVRRDGRQRGGCATVAYQRQTTQLETGGLAAFELSPTGIMTPLPYVFTFSGNGFPVIETKVANVAAQIALFGYERVADKHEVDATVV